MGKLKATHQGELDLNGFNVSCAVLEDGTRVLVNRSLATALGIKGSGAYWQKKKEGKGALLPEYVSANYLKPFMSNELHAKLTKPIGYESTKGVETEGVQADLLADICDIFVKAGEKGALKNNQHISENAYQMILAFAKVGITALVDEVTGYQYDREKDELQKILKAYISEELLPWQKRFPDEFYVEIFRLNKWDFTVNGIKKRPGVVGRWTNTLIYDQLPKGVKDELRKNTPKTKSGKLAAQMHRSLTFDVGHPHLSAQINQILTIFRLSDTMEEMWYNFKKMNSRKNGITQLEFKFDENGVTIPIDPPIEEKPLSDFDNKLTKALNYNPKEK